MKTFTYGNPPYATYTCYAEVWNRETHRWDVEPEPVIVKITDLKSVVFPATLTDPDYPPMYFNKPKSV